MRFVHSATSARNAAAGWARHGWLPAALVLVVVFLAANYKLAAGRATPIFDANDGVMPDFVLQADSVRAGRLLLWNPWMEGGSPTSADPGAATYSPIALFIGLLTGGTMRGFCVYWLSFWLIAGLGMLALGRHLGAPAWGALAAALGYIFSGFFIGNAEHTTIIYTMALFPFVIWRLDVALHRRRIGPAFEAGAIWGLSALGGYPEMNVLGGCLAALWLLGRLVCGFPEMNDAKTASAAPPAGPPGRASWRGGRSFDFACLAALAVVGLLILSPPYIAFFADAAGYTDRTGALARDVAAGSDALHPRALTTFASPYLSGLCRNTPSLWSYTDISMCSLYVPATVFWLAILALCLQPRQRWRWWLAGVGIGSLALAMGQWLPFRGWLYDLFPVFRFFRHSALFRGCYIFVLCVLALLASRDIACRFREEAPPLRRVLPAAGVAAIAALLSFFLIIRRVDDAGPELGLAIAQACAAWLGACALAVMITRPSPAWRTAWIPLALVALTGLDVFFIQRLSYTVYAFRPENLKYAQFEAAHHNPSVDLTPIGLARRHRLGNKSPSNHNVFSKVVVLWGYSPMANRFHEAWVRDSLLSSFAEQWPAGWVSDPMQPGFSRIWFSAEALPLPLSDGLFHAFRERAHALEMPPLIVHSPEDMKRPAGPVSSEPELIARIAQLPAAVPLAATVREYEPTRLLFEIESPGDGWLWVTDRWASGWRATVNGSPTPIWGGNFIFRAVRVRKGLNVVDFTYHPFAWPWLLILSWGTLGLVGVSALVSALRRRQFEPTVSCGKSRVS